jgi:hypothetical protein
MSLYAETTPPVHWREQLEKDLGGQQAFERFRYGTLPSFSTYRWLGEILILSP